MPKTPVNDSSDEEERRTPKYKPRLPQPRGSEFQAHEIFAHRQPVTLDGEEPMYFRSYAESRIPLSPVQWHAPPNDNTIPNSDAYDRVYIRKLVAAFRSIEHANDSPKSQYIGRLKPGATFYEPWAIEACAWNILHVTKKIHTQGFSYDKIFDKEMVKAMELTKNLYFDERIDLICRMLENSKYVAVNLLKDEKLVTTIAAPFKLFTSSLSNNKSNKKRNGWVVAGRAADSTHVPGRHKRQRLDDTSTAASGRVTFSPEAAEDMMDVMASTTFAGACRPFDVCIPSLVADTDSATNYIRTDSAQPDVERNITVSNSVDVNIAGTVDCVTKAIDEKDNDEEIKPTIETGEGWVMLGHQNPTNSKQATNSTVTLRLPSIPASTTPYASPSMSSWHLVAPSAAAAAPTTIIPPRSFHTPSAPQSRHGSIAQHTCMDEVVSAAEMMMLLRSSAHLPIVNRGR